MSMNAIEISRNLSTAFGKRKDRIPPGTDALRLVNGPGDRFRDLVIDDFAGHWIAQTKGDAIPDEIADAGDFRSLWWKRLAKEGKLVLLRLPSGELRRVNYECRATIGQVGNLEHENQVIGKAGRSRWFGRRPGVRGTAMNPIDHPHGGGEGRSKGRHPVTPWGKPTKGYKTRSKKKPSNKFIVKRRK